MSTYIRDECFHNAIVKLKDIVEKYKNEKNLEIEFRLGYLENEEFKTDIGKEFFDKIMNKLLDSKAWESVNTENSEDYFYNGRRLTVSKDDPKGTCIKKEKLAVFDFIFSGTGFDLRVSFSREEPSKRFDKEKANYKRIKNRTCFVFKHLSFDLTQVTMEENTVEDHLFEIELETKKLDLEKMTSHYLIHDSLLKIKDLVKMCEEINDDCKLDLAKEKIFN